MTDKEFRRLSRKELVDIIFELQKQLKVCQEDLDRAEAALSAREAKFMQAGSIAEAALSLHDVFARAQAAADQYVTDVQWAYERAQSEADKIIAEAQAKAQEILTQAREEREAMIRWTKI